MVLKLGLTGGIGSGKSTIANYFEAFGANIIDADLIARQVVAPGTTGLKAIQARFGTGILQADGQLNRAELRKIIFNAEEEKLWLEQLLHPLIRNDIELKLSESTPLYHVLVSPLLFETQQNILVDQTILVDCPVETQIIRTSTRDNIEKELVKKIIATQMSREDKLALSDFVIDNNQPLENSKLAVEQLHQRFIKQLNS